jgi:hypothetical protein
MPRQQLHISPLSMHPKRDLNTKEQKHLDAGTGETGIGNSERSCQKMPAIQKSMTEEAGQTTTQDKLEQFIAAQQQEKLSAKQPVPKPDRKRNPVASTPVAQPIPGNSVQPRSSAHAVRPRPQSPSWPVQHKLQTWHWDDSLALCQSLTVGILLLCGIIPGRVGVYLVLLGIVHLLIQLFPDDWAHPLRSLIPSYGSFCLVVCLGFLVGAIIFWFVS